MPYFRCPNCSLLVRLAANDLADTECPRCHVPLYEAKRRGPRVELAPFARSTSGKPGARV
jgi:uncharacterized paraquat-inducible protein A